ncbi:MAG: 4Fe-4S dicluster domain-containing protein [Dehalococcoidales bacterium]|nr:4Fe-4S dicluster domain-containing protein [Dehalococcoidales bacterium]
MLEMLRNVLANLFASPATRRYPVERREPFPEARGHIVFDADTCAFCGACSRRCPASAITVNRQERTIVFEPFRCIICEACAEVCPRKSITTDNRYRAPAYGKTTEIYHSSAPAAEKKPQVGAEGAPAT